MSTPTSRSALILIDIQQSFEKMPFWSDSDLPAFRQAVLGLDAECRARGVPVVHIFHVGAAGPFTEASGHVRPMQWLESAPDVVFIQLEQQAAKPLWSLSSCPSKAH